MFWFLTAALAADGGCSASAPLTCMQEAVAQRAEAPEAAAAMLQTACDAGLADGCSTLGAMKASGELGAPDPSGALALFERACLEGSAHGCSQVTGALVRTEPARAAKVLEAACGRDVSVACEDLGALHANGTGVARDESQAIALYRRACELPRPSCRQLGVRTVEGRGVDQDVGAGLRMLQTTCAAGSAQTCRTLVGYLDDPGVTTRDPGALAMARQAGCEAGDAWSCAGLGFQLYKGDGIPADEAGALVLLAKACDGGEGAACGGLGFHHREAGDVAAAKEWFAKGCMAQLDQACLDLAALNNPK